MHRIAGGEQFEPISLYYHTITDVSRNLIELRDAIIVPGGGIVWNGFWINGLDLQYYAASWARETWRPGDFNESEGTIEISDSRLATDHTIDGPSLFCDSHWAAINFGHFVHDLLPYGRLFRRLRHFCPAAAPIIRPMKWQAQREILSAVFEFPETSFTHFDGCALARHLYVARRQSMLDGRHWTTSFAEPRDARQLALAAFGRADIQTVTKTTHPLKIFLHRKLDPSAPDYRRLLRGRNFSNVHELALALMDDGFVVLEPGGIPVRLLAGLVSRAHLIAGIHGANMGNIIFGHPGARVVEIRGAHGAWDDYAAVAAVLDQKHDALPQPLPIEGEPPAIDVAAMMRFLSSSEVC